MSSSQITVHPPLEISPLDLRLYRAITLPNALRVLLVSDLRSDKAAAAMDVSVGNFSDPSDIPGLAHFLEHMLFLGTEKYPEEGSYNRFLAENGGHSNAYTSSENTNFHFEMIAQRKVVEEQGANGPDVPRFKEALDRFAQFFTAPLFTESATERELNAVHSEHQKNLQSDTRRIYQLKKSLCNCDHPYYKFSTGSKETLSDIPKETGVDTRAALLEFHRKYYSANLMALCVVGPYDLDVLQEWIVELFSSIPNHNVPHPSEQYRTIVPLLPEHLGLIYQMETIKDIRLLELSWLTPSYVTYYRSKPARYVAGLLGDEGEGSILSLLKVKGWADSLSAGIIDQMTFGLFQVNMTLTKEGVHHIEDIVAIVYDYIRMSKEHGIQEWLFKEESTLAATSFRFMEVGSFYTMAISIASHMHHFPPEQYISALYLYKKFDAEKIMEVFDCLTPENGNILVAGRFVSDKVNQKERWYDTPYHVKPIEEAKLRAWKDGSTNPNLHIPIPNPFIPSDFDLRAEPLPSNVNDLEGPKVILRNEYMCIHHKLDRTFRRPKATIILQMLTPLTYHSPWHSVMSNIFTYMLEDALTEYSYAAERAGFQYSLMHSKSGMRLIVEGYSHRIDTLLEAIIKKMTTFEAEQTRFEMIRDAVERDYLNFDMAQPYNHAMYTVNYLLEEPRWHVREYVRVLQDGSITLEALNHFAKDIQERLFVLALISGNITADSAISILKSVQSTVKYRVLPDSEKLQQRIVQAPVGTDVMIRFAHPNTSDNNSAINIFYEIGPKGDFDVDVKIELLADIMSKPTFHELRTKQQLGYIVSEGLGYCEHVHGISFIVQSTVANPDELVRRIDSFLAEFRRTTLQAMSEDKFQDYVRSLTANKAEPDKKLSSQSWRFWREIIEGYRQYDRAQKEIEALKLATKEDILTFFDDHIALGGALRRRVITQVYGNQHPLKDKEILPEEAIEVKDAIAFRRQQMLYPVGGIHNPETEVVG